VPARFANAATSRAAPDPVAMPAWQDVFIDPVQQVISLALDNNRDLRVAMLDIDKGAPSTASSARRCCRRWTQPASWTAGAFPMRAAKPGTARTRNYDAQIGTSSWEIDLFGRCAA
jgi:multidrug efflux system outer membrane protein